MLLGVEKKRKQEEEQVESSIDLRSELSHLDDDSGIFILFVYLLIYAFIDVYLRIDSERKKEEKKRMESVETVDFYV